MNEQIKVWKRLYGPIFKTKIQGQEYIYRTLTVEECGLILLCLKQDNRDDAEDKALEAVIYPVDFDITTISIGVAKCLADYIIEAAGIFTENGFKDIIEKARENVKQFMSDDLAQWKLVLLKVFPGYTFDKLNNLPIQEFFNLIALAEEITGQKFIESKNNKKSKQPQRPQTKFVENKVDLATDKFMSQRELELIAAEEATKNLQKHWSDNKRN